ncbi:MAG: ATP-binding protein [Bacteroidales bacterium]|nr:ATP-binding protein [Bacteroidales bacterium]
MYRSSGNINHNSTHNKYRRSSDREKYKLLLSLISKSKIPGNNYDKEECDNGDFDTLLRNSLIGTLVLKGNRLITTINKRFTEICGYTQQELENKSAEIIHVDKEHFIDFGNKHYDGLRVKNVITEWPFRHKNGNVIWCNITGMAVNQQRLEDGILWLIEDITERKAYEKQLVKAKLKAEESDRLKTAFLQNMSHEIRTPMNGIIGFSRFLKDPDLTHEERQEYIEIISSSSQQLLNVVSDILDISRIETKQMKIKENEVDVSEVIMDIYLCFKPKAKEKRLKFELQENNKQNGVTITTDYEKLSKILYNLVSNAIKYTDSGYIKLGYTVNTDNIEFCVQDSGIGIEQDKHELIFQHFRQATNDTTKKYGGTGLGLAISKGLVNLLGGDIWVESIPGKGSKFNFKIPKVTGLNPENSASDDQLKEDNVNELEKSPTLLVAEDEDINFRFITEALRKQKFNIIRAKNGLEAVDLCEKNQEISLVLMDIKMPEMDGYDATKLIKKSRPGLPVIAVTAFALDQDGDNAMEAGCDHYLSKPVDPDELVESINKFLVSSF